MRRCTMSRLKQSKPRRSSPSSRSVRKWKETDRRSTRTDNFVGDVTIDDFADTSRERARFKKSVTNIFNEVKQESEATKHEEELMQDETCKDILLKDNIKGRRNRRKSKCQKDDNEDEGIDYPLDVWFIISEYIQPEAVGKFARICKSSYYVTTTGKFWFHLYRSYYEFVPNLPERLQPQCMVLHGLRARVIRTLHYSYFKTSEAERDNMSYLRQEEPHSLVKRKCTLMWHKQAKIRWYFYFKLKDVSKTHNRPFKQNKSDAKRTEFDDTLKDVAVNPEDGCKVLRVSCLKYNMLPLVIGLVLQTVSMNLMPGFREQRLQLGFGTSNVPNTLMNQITLSNVIEYSILNWWDPAYPHQDLSNTIELPQSDCWEWWD